MMHAKLCATHIRVRSELRTRHQSTSCSASEPSHFSTHTFYTEAVIETPCYYFLATFNGKGQGLLPLDDVSRYRTKTIVVDPSDGEKVNESPRARIFGAQAFVRHFWAKPASTAATADPSTCCM
ncbi:unnamed protein product [Ectocarpus sp. 4 AP-2014]